MLLCVYRSQCQGLSGDTSRPHPPWVGKPSVFSAQCKHHLLSVPLAPSLTHPEFPVASWAPMAVCKSLIMALFPRTVRVCCLICLSWMCLKGLSMFVDWKNESRQVQRALIAVWPGKIGEPLWASASPAAFLGWWYEARECLVGLVGKGLMDLVQILVVPCS